MLDATDLECRRGRRCLFSGVSFSLRPGACIEVRGPNGSGKSTLLRTVCGLLPPARGVIHWNGDPIGVVPNAFRSSLTYIGHRAAVSAGLTALENVRVAHALSGSAVSPAAAHDALRRVGLAEQAGLFARQLSEGQRRRLALTRLACCRRPLWVLDEILAALDASAADAATTLVDEHLARGGMAIVATHHAVASNASTSGRIELAA